MAPFKLKFRMGGSRSTSQEQDTDVMHSTQIVINSTTSLIKFDSTSTIDSDHNTDSLVSLNNTCDQRALLQNCSQTSNDQIGFINHHSSNNKQNNTTTTVEQQQAASNINKNCGKIANAATIIPSTPPPSYEHVLEENRLAALDQENNQTFLLETIIHSPYNIMNQPEDQQYYLESDYCHDEDDEGNGTHGSQVCTDASCVQNQQQQQQQHQQQQQQDPESVNDEQSNMVNNGETSMCNLDDESVHLSDIDYTSYDNDGSGGTYQHGGATYQLVPQQTPTQKPRNEIIYKSSKEMYKAVAKECGITCKMSDQCRCYDCQSRYFDCEYEQNENEKTDGGLGAGTPMFISEVMHGSACTIL